jgi:hypothetical protein
MIKENNRNPSAKTYLCGKIGKSVKFNPKTWSAIGGDCEAPELLRKMAELNPDDTFVIITRNDVDKHRNELGIPDNLVDVYSGASKEERKDLNFVSNALKDKKIDGCFLMSGPTANCNIPNKSWKRTLLKNGEKQYAKALETFINYVAPVYNFLNESNIPWVMIANDPRYIRQGNDLQNQPVKILSQYDETILMQCFDNWEDQNYIKNEIPSVYAGMEKMFLIDKEKPSQELIDSKKTKFMVVLNEGNNGVKSRYPMIKEYILDHIDDVEIYGKWDEDTVKGDTRFKGSIKFEDLQEKLSDVKYSFMVSITDGWVTMKVWELISHGIIPFMHPNYDNQMHCKVPDYIRISEPAELHTKIEELENNPVLYKKILSECINAMTDDDFSGKKLSDTILNSCPNINKVGIEIKPFEHEERELDDW